jgi:hypothetical protein
MPAGVRMVSDHIITPRQVSRKANITMNNDQDAQHTVYQIKMQGRLDESWSGWFGGMAITLEGDTTTLTGAVADQAALRGVLSRLWDLNLALISVNPIESDPE